MQNSACLLYRVLQFELFVECTERTGTYDITAVEIVSFGSRIVIARGIGIRRGDVDGAVSAVVGADVLLGDGNVTLFVANEVKFDASAPVRDFIHRSAFFLVKFEPGIDTREHAVVGIIARTQQIPLHDLHIDAEQRTASTTL